MNLEEVINKEREKAEEGMKKVLSYFQALKDVNVWKVRKNMNSLQSGWKN